MTTERTRILYCPCRRESRKREKGIMRRRFMDVPVEGVTKVRRQDGSEGVI